MGSYIEMNDTLQIKEEQGFPEELNLEKHLKNPLKAEDFKDKVFKFHGKKDVRFYHVPPVRVFLAENIDGKWLYWGLVYITKAELDYEKKETRGEFEIIYLYTPEEMKIAHDILDRNPNTRYFE